MNFIFALVGLGSAMVMVTWLIVRRGMRAEFLREARALTDVVVVRAPGYFGSAGLATPRGSSPPVRVISVTGTDSAHRWECRSVVQRLGARTTFYVDQRVSAERRRFGRETVVTGDEQFDVSFSLTGEDHDILRAVFTSSDVVVALRTLFARTQGAYAQLDEEGRLIVMATVVEHTPREARELLLRTQAFARVLGEQAVVRALPAVGAEFVEGVGGASGAPVGIPIGRR